VKDAGHLARMALVFAAGIVIFVVVRGALVPASFGEYGHYRGDAIQENAARPVKFAGQQACADCHGDVVATKVAGRHQSVRCEACHGALGNHVEDPALTPGKLDTAQLCVSCHELNRAKPSSFPQVAAVEHADGIACDTCHEPHSPAIAAEPAKGIKH
jgi:hypothetical protein